MSSIWLLCFLLHSPPTRFPFESNFQTNLIEFSQVLEEELDSKKGSINDLRFLKYSIFLEYRKTSVNKILNVLNILMEQFRREYRNTVEIAALKCLIWYFFCNSNKSIQSSHPLQEQFKKVLYVRLPNDFGSGAYLFDSTFLSLTSSL